MTIRPHMGALRFDLCIRHDSLLCRVTQSYSYQRVGICHEPSRACSFT